MGCFLACFGYTKKRKRLKSCHRIASQDQIHGSYVPLESDVFTELDHTHKLNISEIRDKPKEISSSKKKKVTFNLNVKTYEPLQYDESEDFLSEGEDAAKWEFNKEDYEEETQRETMVDEHQKADTTLRNVPLPANYRYQNCRNSDDEEDGITVEDSDWDDADFEDDEYYDDGDSRDDEEEEEDDEDHSINQVKFPTFASVDKTFSNAPLAKETTNNHMRSSLTDKELNGTESNHNNWQRNQYASSVLRPVENLTQWKAIKSRAKLQKKHQSSILEQENELPKHTKLGSYCISLNSTPNLSPSRPLIPETAVDASLSNWLL